MTYNLKINNILKGVSNYLQDAPNNSADFINRANDTSLEIQNGFIDSLFVVNDSVFAIVRKNIPAVISPSGSQIDHGDGFFNGPDRTSIEDTTVAELAIPTNISAINNQLDRYKDKACRVTVKNGVAVYVEADLGFPRLTTIPQSFIRKARIALQAETEDIFSEIGKKYFIDNGYTAEDVENLSDFKYVSEMTGKINTFEGEGLWFKDTANKEPNENVLKNNPLVLGLNKLNMKTKKCHIPSRLFSGK